MTASDWTKVVTKEYYEFLHTKLSDSKFYDTVAQQHALQEQLEWYDKNIENLLEDKKKKSKINQTMHKVMCPLLAMVSICH